MKEALIVIDASMAASWVLPDEQNTSSKELLNDLKIGKYQPISISLF